MLNTFQVIVPIPQRCRLWDAQAVRRESSRWEFNLYVSELSWSLLQCDLYRPECQRCRRIGKDCPGYPDDWELAFRSENAVVYAKLQKTREAVSEYIKREPSSSLGPHPIRPGMWVCSKILPYLTDRTARTFQIILRACNLSIFSWLHRSFLCGDLWRVSGLSSWSVWKIFRKFRSS